MKNSSATDTAAGNALVSKTIAILEQLRARKPLTHCLTNEVVKDITANALLAIGASPAMVEHPGECEDFSGFADALLINLGTLKDQQTDAIRRAVAAYVKRGKPWIFDPVAVGALAVRTEFARELLRQRPVLIRGNASEIIGLAGGASQGRGADSGDSSDIALDAARSLAASAGSVVLVTGETDYITDGTRVAACKNGHILMTRVTGVGCAQGALAVACVAAAGGDVFHAGVATAAIMAIAGEIAAETATRPGSFRVALLDELDRIDAEIIRKFAKLEKIEN